MMTAFETNKAEFDKVFPSMKLDGVLMKRFPPSKLVEMIKEV